MSNEDYKGDVSSLDSKPLPINAKTVPWNRQAFQNSNSVKTDIQNDATLKSADPDNPEGGDGNMTERYATKDELKTLETKIDGQFNTLSARHEGRFDALDEKFNTMDERFKTLNVTISEGFKTSKAEDEARMAKLESKQSKWFIGTAIAIIAIVVTLVQLL